MESITIVRPSHRAGQDSRLEDTSGLALAATIVVLVLIGILTAAALSGALTSVRTAGTDYHEARAFYAAEAGGEAALAQLKLALQDGYLSDQELAVVQPPPDLADFSYDLTVEKEGMAGVETITDGPYVGLYALTQNVRIYSKAEDANGTASGVVLSAKAQAIPIFQFGVFYEEDLEATNGPPMEFAGRVHSNGNIYLSSNNAWYLDMVTTPNKVFHDRKDHHRVYSGVFINDAAGNRVRLDFDSRSHPMPEAFKAESEMKFDSRLQTDAFGVDSLKLPLPEGVSPYELVRPREVSDGPGEREVKFAWNADTYVTVDLTDVRTRAVVCADAGDLTPWPAITVERTNGLEAPAGADVCNIFSWEWSGFYDGREDELKDLLTLDIAQLAAWGAGNDARLAEIIYVEFLVPDDISGYSQNARDQVLDASLDPAVRLENGALLPNRLTVASEWPLYVRGDYNSIAKQPAALVGDGITILSNAWSDGQNRPGDAVFQNCQGQVTLRSLCPDYETWANGWFKRNASETALNGAILAGHWATPCDHEEAGCPADGSTAFYTDWYGGGIENFPRFLERWSGVWFHYKGSLGSPFTSQKTTGTWNGSYYNPPMRDWAFDPDFRNPALLPPGTPNVGNVLRTALREAF